MAVAAPRNRRVALATVRAAPSATFPLRAERLCDRVDDLDGLARTRIGPGRADNLPNTAAAGRRRKSAPRPRAFFLRAPRGLRPRDSDRRPRRPTDGLAAAARSMRRTPRR